MPGIGIDDIIVSQEAELEVEKRSQQRAIGEIKAILAQARQEGRANVTAQEDEDIQAATKRAQQSKLNIAGIEHKLEISRRTRQAELDIDEHLAERRATPPLAVDQRNMTLSDRVGSVSAARNADRPAYDQVYRISREERTYHKGNTGRGGPFVRDVVMQFLYRDVEAETRLARHMQEERVERGQYLERAAGTGAFSGLTVPQYLTDMYAPAVSNLRPFADACNHHDLPPNGMTVNISRITTATSVALQATENSNVSNTDIDDTLLTENVQTAAGQQTLSRQAIERGTGVEGVVMDDLFRRYAATLDSTLLNQATTGLDAVAATTYAYVDASPTAAEMWPKLLGAASGVESALLGYGGADIAVMHARRWFWMQSQLTNSWPLVGQPFLGNGFGGTMAQNLDRDYGRGARGVLPSGLVVITDNNVGTTLGAGTEDRIYVVSSQECHLWEDPNAPVFIRAEQAAAASLGVLLVLYGYFAYTFRRYASAVQAISGTGMIAPTF